MSVRSLLGALALGPGAVLALLFLLRPAFDVRAGGGIYYVSVSATGDCRSPASPCGSVRQAIGLAVAPGDEVWVAAGVYTENLSITHSLILRGGWDLSFTVQSSFSTPTVLDGRGVHNVRVEEAPTARVLLDGLTLRNGRDGVHVWTGVVTITRCLIRDSVKQGVEVDGGRVVLSGTQILTAQQGVEVDAGVVLVRGVRIAHTAEEGLLVEGGGVVTFTGNTVEDCGRPGVQVDRGRVRLVGNLFREINADGVRVEGGDVLLAANRLYGAASDGLDISGTQVISGNLVVGVGRRGIYAHDGGMTIVGNEVRDAGSDGIRTADGERVTVRRNVVVGAGDDGVDVRGEMVTAEGNVVRGCADNGIRAAAERAELTANLVLSNGVGVAVRDGGLFTLTNSIVADQVTGSVEVGAGGRGVLFHNTLVGGSGRARGFGVRAVGSMTVTLVNNIIVSHALAVTGAVVARYTLVWGNGGGVTGGTPVFAPPGFVAPEEQDYHLRARSPAVDAGEEVGVARDFDGERRPIGPRPDLGADEVLRFVYLPAVLRGVGGTAVLP